MNNVNQKFEVLKKFFESNPTAIKAVSLLSSGVEIGVVLKDAGPCALINEPSGPKFVNRPASNPDIVFVLNDIAIDHVCANLDAGPGDLAVALLKEIKNKEVHLQVTGSYFGIATKGYLSIVKLGGQQMWDYLTEHGLTNIFKITNLIKEMIKRR